MRPRAAALGRKAREVAGGGEAEAEHGRRHRARAVEVERTSGMCREAVGRAGVDELSLRAGAGEAGDG